MKLALPSDLLLDARCEFHGVYELLGAASGQLREAASDNDAGNTQGAMIVVDDLLLTLAELEGSLFQIGALAARWRAWAETGEGVKP